MMNKATDNNNIVYFGLFLHEMPWLDNSLGFKNLIGNKCQKDQNSVEFR